MIPLMMSTRQKGVYQIVQNHIGQFCLPWWIAWLLFILNDLNGLNKVTWPHFIAKQFSTCLLSGGELYVNKSILDLRLFAFKSIGYICPIFDKIGIVRGGAKSLQIEGAMVFLYRENTRDWIILAKKKGAPLCLFHDISVPFPDF